jgi:hypothetical protein
MEMDPKDFSGSVGILGGLRRFSALCLVSCKVLSIFRLRVLFFVNCLFKKFEKHAPGPYITCFVLVLGGISKYSLDKVLFLRGGLLVA